MGARPVEPALALSCSGTRLGDTCGLAVVVTDALGTSELDGDALIPIDELSLTVGDSLDGVERVGVRVRVRVRVNVLTKDGLLDRVAFADAAAEGDGDATVCSSRLNSSCSTDGCSC